MLNSVYVDNIVREITSSKVVLKDGNSQPQRGGKAATWPQLESFWIFLPQSNSLSALRSSLNVSLLTERSPRLYGHHHSTDFDLLGIGCRPHVPTCSHPRGTHGWTGSQNQWVWIRPADPAPTPTTVFNCQRSSAVCSREVAAHLSDLQHNCLLY